MYAVFPPTFLPECRLTFLLRLVVAFSHQLSVLRPTQPVRRARSERHQHPTHFYQTLLLIRIIAIIQVPNSISIHLPIAELLSQLLQQTSKSTTPCRCNRYPLLRPPSRCRIHSPPTKILRHPKADFPFRPTSPTLHQASSVIMDSRATT